MYVSDKEEEKKKTGVKPREEKRVALSEMRSDELQLFCELSDNKTRHRHMHTHMHIYTIQHVRHLPEL